MNIEDSYKSRSWVTNFSLHAKDILSKIFFYNADLKPACSCFRNVFDDVDNGLMVQISPPQMI